MKKLACLVLLLGLSVVSCDDCKQTIAPSAAELALLLPPQQFNGVMKTSPLNESDLFDPEEQFVLTWQAPQVLESTIAECTSNAEIAAPGATFASTNSFFGKVGSAKSAFIRYHWQGDVYVQGGEITFDALEVSFTVPAFTETFRLLAWPKDPKNAQGVWTGKLYKGTSVQIGEVTLTPGK